MTATSADTRAQDRRTAAEEKRARMLGLGYIPAKQPGLCCLCGTQIATGMYIRRMPDTWQPTLKRRWAHRRCIEDLREKIAARAAALGLEVPAGAPR